jgi:hypothetical protein
LDDPDNEPIQISTYIEKEKRKKLKELKKLEKKKQKESTKEV